MAQNQLAQALARANPQAVQPQIPQSEFLKQFLARQGQQQSIRSAPELGLKLAAQFAAQSAEENRQAENKTQAKADQLGQSSELARVFRATRGFQNPDAPGPADPQDGLATALARSTNPEFGLQAIQMQSDRFQADSDASQAADLRFNEQQNAFRIAENKQMRALELKAAPSFSQPVPGRDIPFPPGVADQKRSIRSAGKPVVNVNNSGEKEEVKARAKQRVKFFGDISTRADAAEDAITSLLTARGIKTPKGALEGLKAKAGALGQSLGFSPESMQAFGLNNATTAQAFVGTMQNMVLAKMQAQTGPQTENDSKRIEMTVASITNTDEAADFLLRSQLAVERRKVEMRDFYLDQELKTGSFKGARQAWNKFKSQTPMMGTNPNTRLPVFFSEFKSKLRAANPNAGDDEILSLWRRKYK